MQIMPRGGRKRYERRLAIPRPGFPENILETEAFANIEVENDHSLRGESHQLQQ